MSENLSARDEQLSGIAALAEPVRRDLYRFVVAQRQPVTREEAAVGAGVAVHVAKFHLDKLVDEGLLDVEYARPPGRGGPGAGRPAKHYRRSTRELAVSVPARDYALAGRLFARAVTESQQGGAPVERTLAHAAREAGHEIGARARAEAGRASSRRKLRAIACDALEACGFEPRLETDDSITLVNCPFHALAQEYTDLVCGMNLDLMSGLVDALDDADLEPRLEPADGRCCVRVHTRR